MAKFSLVEQQAAPASGAKFSLVGGAAPTPSKSSSDSGVVNALVQGGGAGLTWETMDELASQLFPLLDDTLGRKYNLSKDELSGIATEVVRDRQDEAIKAAPLAYLAGSVIGSIPTGRAGVKLAGEAISPLAKGVVGGALYGGAAGETPEERAKLAALGGGIGLAVGKAGAMYSKAKSVKRQKVVDEAKNIIAGFNKGVASAIKNGVDPEEAAMQVAQRFGSNGRVDLAFDVINNTVKLGDSDLVIPLNSPEARRAIDKASKVMLMDKDKLFRAYHPGPFSKFLEPMYEIAGKVHAKLGAAFKRFEAENMVYKQPKTAMIEEASKYYSKMPKDARAAFNAAMIRNQEDLATKIAAEHSSKLAAMIPKLRKMLDEVYADLERAGYKDVEYVKGYFPRVLVKRREFMERYGQHVSSKEYNKILDMEDSALRSAAIDKALRRGYYGGVGTLKTGHVEPRKIVDVEDEMIPMYAAWDQALHRYIHEVGNNLHKRKFLGLANRATDWESMEGAFKDSNSIGDLVSDLRDNLQFHKNNMPLVREMIEARFGSGERSASKNLQRIKAVGHIGSIGNVWSAITQVGDIPLAVALHGVEPTITALVRSLTGRAVKREEVGIFDIAVELGTTGRSARSLDQALKWTGFKKIDSFGKQIHLTAAYRKLQNWANKSPNKVTDKYKDFFTSEEMTKVIGDLKSKKMSDEVKAMLVTELADVQPITLSGMPIPYLRHPNGRILYQLKSFTLTQLNIMRREGIRRIKAGNRASGYGFIAKYAGLLILSGASIDYVKDAIQSGLTDQDLKMDFTDRIIGNVFKIMGTSKWMVDRGIAQGDTGAIISQFAPPAIGMANTGMFDLYAWLVKGEAQAESLSYAPFFGYGLKRFLED